MLEIIELSCYLLLEPCFCDLLDKMDIFQEMVTLFSIELILPLCKESESRLAESLHFHVLVYHRKKEHEDQLDDLAALKWVVQMDFVQFMNIIEMASMRFIIAVVSSTFLALKPS